MYVPEVREKKGRKKIGFTAKEKQAGYGVKRKKGKK
jgi:hypothetical protein